MADECDEHPEFKLRLPNRGPVARGRPATERGDSGPVFKGWHVQAPDSAHMQLFTGALSEYLLSAHAEVDIDLIVASPEEDAASEEPLAFLVSLAAVERDERNWLLMKLIAADPLMGFEVNLNDERQRRAFSALVHRVIHAEAWIGDRQIFDEIESGTSLFLYMDESEISAIVEAANAAGANVSYENAEGEGQK